MAKYRDQVFGRPFSQAFHKEFTLTSKALPINFFCHAKTGKHETKHFYFHICATSTNLSGNWPSGYSIPCKKRFLENFVLSVKITHSRAMVLEQANALKSI